jgi:hypothetical protein
LWLRLIFLKVGQKLGYQKKGLVIRNTQVKYQSPTTLHSKAIAKVKVSDGMPSRTKQCPPFDLVSIKIATIPCLRGRQG